MADTAIAEGNSPKNSYLQKAYLDGKLYEKCYLDYRDIVSGGLPELLMVPAPNKKWGRR